MGVIDTLSEGFRLVFRRPWLALLPVLVDLSVWRAPKLSISPIVSQLIGWLNGMAGALASTGGADPDAVTALVQTLEETTARTNLIGLIASSRLGISAISAALPIEVGDRII